MLSFSVFLPVYNEEDILVENTEKLLTFLSTLKVPFEVIIGSNGSTDATVALGKKLEHDKSHVRFFHLAHKGPGDAFQRAVAIMHYDYLICLDMDLSVNLDFVSQAATALEHADIVIGSKKLGVENRSLIRRWGSDLFIASSKRLLRLPFDDYSLGAKGYRKSVLDRYPQAIVRGTFYVQNILYCAFRDGFKVVQIPIICMDYRKSRFNLPREGLYRFACFLLLWLSARVLARKSGVLAPQLPGVLGPRRVRKFPKK